MNHRPNRRHVLTAALALAEPAISRTGSAHAAGFVAAETTGGILVGLSDGDTLSFRGVPYAAPTGDAAPQPVAAWTGGRPPSTTATAARRRRPSAARPGRTGTTRTRR